MPVKNPWEKLDLQPPYVLELDREVVQRTASWKSEVRLDTALMPEPYFGRVDAPVVLLMANPGVGAADHATHRRLDFQAACRESLLHDYTHGAFLHLRPDLQTDGAAYWAKRTRQLSQDVGRSVDDDLLVLQLTPYHSAKFKPLWPPVPSQAYTLHLLEKALNRRAMVIVMRSKAHWWRQAPRLAHHRTHVSRVPLSTYLTPGVLGRECYDELVDTLR